MVQTRIRNWGVIVALVALAGCTQRPMDSRPNEGPVAPPSTTTTPNKMDSQSVGSSAPNWSMSSSQLYQSFVAPFADTALDPSFANNQKLAFTPKALDSLRNMNLAIVLMLAQRSPLLESTGLMQKYDKAIMAGCDANLTGCTSIKFFAQDPNSSKVIQALAQRQKNAHDYYNRLLIAWSIRNSIDDPDLRNLYLARISELNLQNTAGQPSSWQKKNQRILGEMLQTMPQPDCSSKTPAWLITLDPWVTSPKSTSWLGNSSSALYELASACVYQNHGQEINASLSKAIISIQAQPGSFLTLENALFAKSATMMHNLNISKISTQSEYFYIVDRLYTENLSPHDALTIWKGTHQDKKALEQIATNYVRVEMAQLIQESADHMKKYFTDPSKVSDSMIADSISQSHAVALLWQQFLHNSSHVGDFLDSTLQDPTPETRLLRDQAHKFFDGLQRNIDYTVVYPHMMMLAYYMGKREYNRDFQVPGGAIHVDSTIIMNLFFQGNLGSWFNYTGNKNDSPLSSTELLAAFQFALSTDTFKTFGVDVNDFFNLVIDKLLESKVINLRNEADELNANYESAGQWDNILSICGHLQRNESFINHFNFSELPNSIFLGNRYTTLLADANDTSGHSEDIGGQTKFVTDNGYFLYGFKPVDDLEHIRIDIEPVRNYIGWMKTMYHDYLIHSGLSEAEAAKRIAPIQQRLDQVKSAEDQYMAQFYQRHEQVDHCFWTLLNHERDMQNKAIADEEAYLRHVYSDMKLLQTQPNQEAALNRKYAFQNMPEGYTGFNHFTASALTYHTFDLLVRVSQYVSRGYNAGDLQISPIDPNTQVDIPNNITDLDIYNNDQSVAIPYSDNEEQFVADGLKAMFRINNQANLFWLASYNINTTFWRTWLNALALLYRLGPLQYQGHTYQVTAAELLQTPLDMLEYMKLRPEERLYFPKIGVSSRTDAYYLAGALLYDKQERVTGVYDMVHDFLYSPYLGSFQDEDVWSDPRNPMARPSELVPVEKQIKSYYTDVVNRVSFAFPLLTDLDGTLTKHYKEMLADQINGVLTFENALHARFDKGLPDVLVNFQSDLTRDPITPVPLSPSREAGFTGHTNQFNSDTGNMFK